MESTLNGIFFFATSHGKWPCDGIGGTIKRLAAKDSLQRPYCEQTMTPRQLFQFAEDNISGISFFLLHHSGLGRGGQVLIREIQQGKNDTRNTLSCIASFPFLPTKLMVKTYSL